MVYFLNPSVHSRTILELGSHVIIFKGSQGQRNEPKNVGGGASGGGVVRPKDKRIKVEERTRQGRAEKEHYECYVGHIGEHAPITGYQCPGLWLNMVKPTAAS